MTNFTFTRNITPKERLLCIKIVAAMKKVTLGSSKMTTEWVPMPERLLYALQSNFVKKFLIVRNRVVRKSFKFTEKIFQHHEIEGLGEYRTVVHKSSFTEQIVQFIFSEPWILDHLLGKFWHMVPLASVNSDIEGMAVVRVLDGHRGQITITWNQDTNMVRISALASSEVEMGSHDSLKEPFADVLGVPSYRNENRPLCVDQRKYAQYSGQLHRIMYHVNAYVPTKFDSNGNIEERQLVKYIFTSKVLDWDDVYTIKDTTDFLGLTDHIERCWSREEIDQHIIVPLKALDMGLWMNPKRVFGVEEFTPCVSRAPLHLLYVFMRFRYACEITYAILYSELYCVHYTKADLATIPVFFQFPIPASLEGANVQKKQYCEGLCQAIMDVKHRQHTFTLAYLGRLHVPLDDIDV